jgi:Cd2+/Zn2+-exporting ATPase
MNAPLRTRIRVEGMDCPSCAMKVETAARRDTRVRDVSVSATTQVMTLDHDAALDIEALGATIRKLGYGFAPISAPQPTPASQGCCGGAHSPPRDHGHDDHCRDQAHDHARAHEDGCCGGGRGGDGAAKAAPSHPHDHAHAHDDEPGVSWWATAKARLTLAAGAAGAFAYALGLALPAQRPALFVVATFVGLIPIARRAVAAAMNGSPFTIETLMTIAALGAMVIGAQEEAASVVFLFLVGEMLEGVAAGRARASIQSLAALTPRTALREENGATREVAADALRIGDIVLIRPGERAPADGVVIDGASGMDESPITGESAPVRKQAGDKVFAGAINGAAALRLRVDAAARDNTIARIVRLVEDAQEKKAPTQRMIDRFARWYTPGVMIAAALVALAPPLLAGAAWSEWIYKGLAVLLIGCPCALVISTPAAVAAALSAGARRGLLIKGGAALEALGAVTRVAFDKTGTLTQGRPEVTDILAFAASERETLRLAAGLETGSSHPLAQAILRRAQADGVTAPPARDHRAFDGEGVTANVEGRALFVGSPDAAGKRATLTADQSARLAALQGDGKSLAVLIENGAALGALALRDEPRDDAREGLSALARLGVKTTMLSGDAPRVAQSIGAALGVEAKGGLMPQDKLDLLRKAMGGGETVAMVGDGVNDAPALAAADVGVAMGGGTDVALETADAATLHGRVGDVSRMIVLSRATRANIRQNIALALGLKAVFLVTTILGVTGLWPAILADTGATVLVTANALRLLKWRA